MDTTITLTLAPKQRKSKSIVMFNCSDRKNAIQLPRTLFGEIISEAVAIRGDFAEPRVAAPRVERKRLTAEERKALPKPTLAERVEQARKRAARLEAKLQAESAAV